MKSTEIYEGQTVHYLAKDHTIRAGEVRWTCTSISDMTECGVDEPVARLWDTAGNYETEPIAVASIFFDENVAARYANLKDEYDHATKTMELRRDLLAKTVAEVPTDHRVASSLYSIVMDLAEAEGKAFVYGSAMTALQFVPDEGRMERSVARLATVGQNRREDDQSAANRAGQMMAIHAILSRIA